MEQRENSPTAAPWILDGGFVLASFVLAYRALDPFNGIDPFRPAFQLVQSLVVCLFVAIHLVRSLLSPRLDYRACSLLVLATCLYLATLLDRWAVSTPGRLTSALSAGLTYSVGGLPWLALVLSVSVLALGFLQFEALRQLTTRFPTRWSMFVAGFGSGLSSILWLRAILGYVSGSPNL